MKKPKRKHRNHLFTLRRVRGYKQKHVAHLLGLRGTHMISRYETGQAVPPLHTALLLQVVLGAQLSDIYADLYKDLQLVAVRRATKLTPALGAHIRGRVLGRD
jgi:DNA-binding XRE family transcriptional regulator